MSKPTIVYTKTDEAPMLATYSLLPIIQTFLSDTGVDVVLKDISVAGRILSRFPEHLTDAQKSEYEDELAKLGKLALTPEANIIKLPNISASVPQMKAAIQELQSKGFKVPDFSENPQTDAEKKAMAIYNTIKGSAVNPVLREGNSDRRAPPAVKAYARKYPHRMGKWASDSKSHVSTMSGGDFKSNEKSVTLEKETEVTITHVGADGTSTTLKKLKGLEGEILDGTFMSKAALVKFLDEQVADSKEQGVLFSLHLKATMMKISDPIIFGHGVESFFKPLFAKHGETFQKLGVDVRNGFGDLLQKVATLSAGEKAAIDADIQKCFDDGPAIAMVDSDKGITNLHVPSDVIIDASMPAALRDSGKMWNKDNKRQDMKAVIPDSSYAGVFQAVIDFCRKNGAFDPTTMGSCPNVGLMAQKAEEYGSHDKTFEISAPGKVVCTDSEGNTLFEHEVETGDIWRMCQAKDAPIRNWVGMAVQRAKATGAPAVFWLDPARAHDAQILTKVHQYLKDHDTSDITIKFLPPAEACQFSLERIAKGEDAISVTGNVLRDFNTDLFPILEVGTSAKMLSIVPLMAGGGMFETGAGGSAPKHIQQFQEENHLRWDSLGEFLAIALSLEHIAEKFDLPKAKAMGVALSKATETLLLNNKGPGRKVMQHDNRGSHFYLALYWAQEIVKAEGDSSTFKSLADALAANEDKIVKDLIDCQGNPLNIGGYYLPDDAKLSKEMRPSECFNKILADFSA